MDESVTSGSGPHPGPRRRPHRALAARVWVGAAGYAERNARSLRHLLTNELPEDVREEEVVVSICFRSSLVLNALTGGHPEMTFSARCHLHWGQATWVLPVVLWGLACCVIDLACAALRGEREHCATAWQNHCARAPTVEPGERDAGGAGLGAAPITEF